MSREGNMLNIVEQYFLMCPVCPTDVFSGVPVSPLLDSEVILLKMKGDLFIYFFILVQLVTAAALKNV